MASLQLTPIVCSIARQSLLPEPSRVAEAPHPARLHRLPRLSAILVQAAVPQISYLSRADATAPRAVAAGEVQAGHYEPGSGPATRRGGDEGVGAVASRALRLLVRTR